MNVAAQQCDELLRGNPGIGNDERARLDRAAQKGLDLDAGTLRPGAPENLAELGKTNGLADDDAVNRDRVRGQYQVEKSTRDLGKRCRIGCDFVKDCIA